MLNCYVKFCILSFVNRILYFPYILPGFNLCFCFAPSCFKAGRGAADAHNKMTSLMVGANIPSTGAGNPFTCSAPALALALAAPGYCSVHQRSGATA